MKKTICILLCIMVMTTGCEEIKDKLMVRNKKNTTTPIQVETVVKPSADSLSMPKISGIQFFGKDIWEGNGLSMSYIGQMEGDMSETIFLPVNTTIGEKNSGIENPQSQLMVMPNRADYNIEKEGEKLIETGMKSVAKTIINLGSLYVVGTGVDGNLTLNVYNSEDLTNKFIFKDPASAIGTGVDVVVNGDGGATVIGNVESDGGKTIGSITRLDGKGAVLWSNQLRFDDANMWVDEMVRLDDDRTLVLCHIYEKIGYKVLLIDKGQVVKGLDLNYIAKHIKKSEDGSFYIFGVDKLIEQEIFGEVLFETVAKLTKIDAQLNVEFSFETDVVNQFADFVKLEENTFIFVGNKALDAIMTTYFDTGETLEVVKTETYPKQGIPTQILHSYEDGEELYRMTGYSLSDAGTYTCSYGWMTYLYTLNPALEALYARMLNNDGEVRYLVRGESPRRQIALAIAAAEGNEQLMYIRYMRSDDQYAFVVTGKWDDCQIVTQYLLKNEETGWRVLETYPATEKILSTILTNYPDINPDILPPFEVADYKINYLEDEAVSAYIAMVDQGKTLDNLDFISYVDEYMVLIFDDESGYMIINPDSQNQEIHDIQTVDYYNLYLMNEERPPYFIFMQD